MKEKTFEDGLTAGKIETLEAITSQHKDRLDNHGGRLRVLERALWITLGIIVFAQIWPRLEWLFNTGSASAGG